MKSYLCFCDFRAHFLYMHLISLSWKGDHSPLTTLKSLTLWGDVLKSLRICNETSPQKLKYDCFLTESYSILFFHRLKV